MRDYSNYLKKYPWLKGYDPYPESEADLSTCALNWIPEGWVDAFGELMCQELDAALRKTDQYDEAYVVEAKEKFGELRMWIHPPNEETDRILMKYEAISAHVCMHCSAVDVPMLNIGHWLSVYCRHCYDKMNSDGRHKPYDEVVDGDAEMPIVVKWSRFGKNGTEHFEMDIRETVEKIRKRCAERKANGEFEGDLFEGWEDNYYGA